jgi:hypothetical protein
VAKFVKGQSGNPGGMPKGVAEVKRLAQTHTADAIGALVRVLKTGESESAIVAAATALLDRGFGKPTQHIEADVRQSLVSILAGLGAGQEDAPEMEGERPSLRDGGVAGRA